MILHAPHLEGIQCMTIMKWDLGKRELKKKQTRAVINCTRIALPEPSSEGLQYSIYLLRLTANIEFPTQMSKAKYQQTITVQTT